MAKRQPTPEQQAFFDSKAKKLVVSASAGSGKTFIVIEKLIDLIINKKVPIERLLVLTFTKVAAQEIKTRLTNAILENDHSKDFTAALDSLPLSDISTIDSFCEKVIKRNISKLDINENFTILDEKSSEKLKKSAFDVTYQDFIENNADLFEEIYLSFMKNKDSIKECIYYIQDYFSAKWNEEELLEKFQDVEKLEEESQKRLKEEILLCQSEAGKILHTINCPLSATESKFAEQAQNFVNQSVEGSFFELSQKFNSLEMPTLKGKHKDEAKIPLISAREYLKKIINLTENYTFMPEGVSKKLPTAILAFYKNYVKNYTMLKNKKSALDFADLERQTHMLLGDDEVKQALQEKYDYIFIDEYQDTNRLQEAILKPIAEGGYFVAVGDIKQGIYGFRNASMEIMLEAIENFSIDSEGEALKLNGNFRTEKGILDFVNDVFNKIMTKESVGLDYKTDSNLKALMKFKRDGNPSVAVDIILPDGEESVCTGVYDLKNDNLKIDEKFEKEVNQIIRRIEMSLESNIYDARLEKFRTVQYSDIALLFRNRSQLMSEVTKKLRERGVLVNADLKEPLIEDSQIALIVSLLKLTLQLDDDISLASVMCSVFGRFSIDEIALLRKTSKDKFSEIVLSSQDEKIKSFLEQIEKFKFEVQVFGIIKALCRLFNRTKYYDYLSSLNNGREKLGKINSLFKLIRSSGLDYSTAGLISTLEQSSYKGGEGGGNAITITTIHSTKGLEYPIVILCGCGESLNKPFTKQYILNDKFGLGCYMNDFEKMQQIPSLAFVAGKLENKKREFVDEIMIFYVALTRAQNHLYIIGKGKKSDFTFNNLNSQSSYLKLIMFALGQNFTSNLFEAGMIQTNCREFNVISEVESKQTTLKQETIYDKFKEEIKKYDDFVYPKKELCKISLKNTVIGLLKEDTSESETPRVNSKSAAIEQGNAYHEALKVLDFDKVKMVDDLKSVKEKLSEEHFKLLDLNVLFKNVTIIKSVTKGCTLYKEREFIMQCQPEDIGEKDGDNKLIVQGIVDLFAIGEKVILIDYKFSAASPEKLLERYKTQLDLYSLAIERATGRKVDEKYILSLKEGKLISA